MLNELAKEVREVNEANGWNVLSPQEWRDPNKVPALLALVHSEVSEALESFRINDLENFHEELADIVIRVLDIGYGLGVDFEASIRAKLEKNKTRGHRHGGKRI